MKVLLIVIASLLFTFNVSFATDPLNLYSTPWGQAGQVFDVDPYLLYAISIIESRHISEDGLVRPHPYALHINKNSKSHFPKSKIAASTILSETLRTTRNVDIGAMQINYMYHSDKVDRAEDLLDLTTNIYVAAQILSFAMKSTPDLILGAGRYHQWKNEQQARRYGYKAVQLAIKLQEVNTGDNS